MRERALMGADGTGEDWVLSNSGHARGMRALEGMDGWEASPAKKGCQGSTRAHRALGGTWRQGYGTLSTQFRSNRLSEAESRSEGLKKPQGFKGHGKQDDEGRRRGGLLGRGRPRRGDHTWRPAHLQSPSAQSAPHIHTHRRHDAGRAGLPVSQSAPARPVRSPSGRPAQPARGSSADGARQPGAKGRRVAGVFAL